MKEILINELDNSVVTQSITATIEKDILSDILVAKPKNKDVK